MINISSARRIRMENHVVSIVTLKRPSTDVDWNPTPNLTPEILSRFREKYYFTGKSLERVNTFSEDGLTLTIKTTWVSNEIRNIYTKDSEIRELNLRNKQYWNEVGIEATWENIEYLEDTETVVNVTNGTLNDTRHLDELAS
jgi:hypothetical protein